MCHDLETQELRAPLALLVHRHAHDFVRRGMHSNGRNANDKHSGLERQAEVEREREREREKERDRERGRDREGEKTRLELVEQRRYRLCLQRLFCSNAHA